MAEQSGQKTAGVLHDFQQALFAEVVTGEEEEDDDDEAGRPEAILHAFTLRGDCGA